MEIVEKVRNFWNSLDWKLRCCVFSFIGVCLICGYGARLLSNLIGFVYPAYCSVKAVESKDKNDDTKWLVYWVVFAAFILFESVSNVLLSWFPFYYLCKCIFLAWCFAPSGTYNGALIMYNKFIRPVYLEHETDVDRAITSASDRLSQLAESAASLAQENITSS